MEYPGKAARFANRCGWEMVSYYFNQVRREIEPFLPAHAETVFEIGCGSASTLAWMKDTGRAKKVIGIEVSEAAASGARSCVDEVVVTDIEKDGSLLDRYRAQGDIVLLLDVLEHLHDPCSSLRQIKQIVKPGGLIIASIPNIRSIKVLFPLVFLGEFEYADSGILDRTHLVFFTKKPVLQLFKDCGMPDVEIRAAGPVDPASGKTLAGKLTAIFNLATFRLFQDFIANQWLVKAKVTASIGDT